MRRSAQADPHAPAAALQLRQPRLVAQGDGSGTGAVGIVQDGGRFTHPQRARCSTSGHRTAVRSSARPGMLRKRVSGAGAPLFCRFAASPQAGMDGMEAFAQAQAGTDQRRPAIIGQCAAHCPRTTAPAALPRCSAALQAVLVADLAYLIETYSAGLADLVNAQLRHAFAGNRGDGITSS
jgi:hypothetical protein